MLRTVAIWLFGYAFTARYFYVADYGNLTVWLCFHARTLTRTLILCRFKFIDLLGALVLCRGLRQPDCSAMLSRALFFMSRVMATRLFGYNFTRVVFYVMGYGNLTVRLWFHARCFLCFGLYQPDCLAMISRAHYAVSGSSVYPIRWFYAVSSLLTYPVHCFLCFVCRLPGIYCSWKYF